MRVPLSQQPAVTNGSGLRTGGAGLHCNLASALVFGALVFASGRGLAEAGTEAAVAEADFPPEQLEFFEKHIRPVLAERCYDCHSVGAEKLKASLYADSRQGLLNGGDTGPSLMPGDVDGSLIIEAIRYKNPDLEMPPKGKLSDEEIARFEEWVSLGAPWPKEAAPEPPQAAKKSSFDLEKRRAEHWSWQPVEKRNPPAVKDEAWPKSPIDQFILAKLETAGLTPAGEAESSAWLRRVSFDLTGLPPSVEQLHAFLRDIAVEGKDAAYAKTVDSLLASPHYGERWARHWMDLVRYGETCGHEFDYPIPYAYRYRDYLIRAFNSDLPYDQFVTEHVAGDLLAQPRRETKTGVNESIQGTAFWFLHEAVHAPTDIVGDEAGRVDNQIDVFGKTFLGMTIACARCHDHKFDAISTKDYYALAGYLHSSRRQEAALDPEGRIAAELPALEKLREQAAPALSTAFGAEAKGAFLPYLMASQAVLEAHAKGGAGDSEQEIFADFEAPSYGDWKPEGQAFGEMPAAGTFNHQQPVTGYLGKGLVNSYKGSDKYEGTLTSPEFVIQHPFIHFLIGGGAHAEKTCANLVVDGDVVRTAMGRNLEILEAQTWNVTELKGKRARIQIVDRAQGGWGHVNFDHVVFSNSERPGFGTVSDEVPEGLITQVATERGLSPEFLRHWVTVLRDEETRQPWHPLYPWAALVLENHPDKKASLTNRLSQEAEAFETAVNRMDLIADFEGGSLDGWTNTGFAFAGRDAARRGEPALATGELVLETGAAHSGLLTRQLDGVLRSPTFILKNPQLHLRLNATGATVRMVIDSHYMNNFHTLLLKGTILKPKDSNTDGYNRWKSMAGDVEKYVGHRVYLEVTDDEDGYIALDEIRGANEALPPEPANAVALEILQTAKTGDADSLSQAYQAIWERALSRLATGAELSEADANLLNLVWREELLPGQSQALLALQKEIKDQGRALPRPEFVTAMLDGTPENVKVHIRGSHKALGETVPRRFLEALGGTNVEPPATGSGRLDLARQMTAPENPLLARVAVNRMWHHLFGRGIVPTVDDFGVMGLPPSHPELLDWLASEYQARGWSQKALLKEIVLSRTYRMSVTPADGVTEAQIAASDPDNVLLHCAPVRRLEAEAVRDALLSVAGDLEPELYGPSVPVHLTSFMEGRGRPKSSGPLDGDGRRSIYQEIRRNFLPPFMMTFDMPIPFSSMGRRSVSNVPAQSLALMNDPLVSQQAAAWAEHLLADAGSGNASDEAKLHTLFESAFSREPEAAEVTRTLEYLAARRKGGDEEAAIWTDLCHVLFNKKEFIFLN